MKLPLVSIIIPVYNGSNYVKEAIESALKQTYKNIEILVINDGSNDNNKTEKIALSYGNKIRYYKKKNGGVSSALNFGIKKMKGEFISWVSHDDRIMPNKIELQIEYLIKNNLLNKKVVLYSDHNLINKNSKYIESCNKMYDAFNEKSELALLNGKINGITMLIPKKCFDECGYFDENLVAVQDYEMWDRIFKKYKPIHMPLILSESRYHSKQVTNVSPKVISEGNPFWINLVEKITDKKKKKLYGSKYNFYKQMFLFFKNTPYKEAQKHCENKLKNIISSIDVENIDEKVSVITLDNSIKMQELKSQSYKNIEIVSYEDKSKVTGKYVVFIDECFALDMDCIKQQLYFMKLNDANISVLGVNNDKLLTEIINKNISLNMLMIKKELFDNSIMNNISLYLLDKYKNDYIFCLEKKLVHSKQINTTNLDNYIHYKNLLKYLINDDFYEKNDYIISEVASKYTYYSNLVKRVDDYKKNEEYSLIKHIKKSLKMDGFISTLIKIIKKVGGCNEKNR